MTAVKRIKMPSEPVLLAFWYGICFPVIGLERVRCQAHVHTIATGRGGALPITLLALVYIHWLKEETNTTSKNHTHTDECDTHTSYVEGSSFTPRLW